MLYRSVPPCRDVSGTAVRCSEDVGIVESSTPQGIDFRYSDRSRLPAVPLELRIAILTPPLLGELLDDRMADGRAASGIRPRPPPSAAASSTLGGHRGTRGTGHERRVRGRQGAPSPDGSLRGPQSHRPCPPHGTQPSVASPNLAWMATPGAGQEGPVDLRRVRHGGISGAPSGGAPGYSWRRP
jgi:hypothetical protein